MADSGVTAANAGVILTPQSQPGAPQLHTYTQGQTIRYSFLDSLPDIVSEYGQANVRFFGSGLNAPGEEPFFAPFNAAAQAAVRSVFDQIERITTLRFVLAGNGDVADIRFGVAEMSGATANGAAVLGVTFPMADRQDIYLDDGQLGFLGVEQRGFSTLVHEILHALGLQHAGNALPISNPDAHRVTLMADQGGSLDDRYGSSPLLLDIEALQQRYRSGTGEAASDAMSGVASSAASNNYVFGGTASSSFHPFSIATTEVRGIWDAGGTDTLDASAVSTRLAIDLLPGHLSSIGRNNNIGIAFNTIIENATGGAANDFLEGNDVANVLVGNGGIDVFNGRGGQDRLDGGVGADILDGGRGDWANDTLEGGVGVDTYILWSNGGTDSIRDTGSNHLQFRTVLSGGSFTYAIRNLSAYATGAPNTWISPDGKVTFTRNSPLTMTTDDGFTVVFEDWQEGDFNIQLHDGWHDPETTRDIIGDRKWIDSDPSIEGLQLTRDSLDNIETDPDVFELTDDTLSGSGGGDFIDGGQANNTLFGRGADDRIITGSGDDYVEGGDGDDLVEVGGGGDYVLGGAGRDQIYATTKSSISAAVAGGDAQSGTGALGAFINGGSGDDLMVGGAGNDFLAGGGGADLIIGGGPRRLQRRRQLRSRAAQSGHGRARPVADERHAGRGQHLRHEHRGGVERFRVERSSVTEHGHCGWHGIT
jgi:serralysin